MAEARSGRRDRSLPDASARLEAVLALPAERSSIPALLAAGSDWSPEVARAALRRLATLAGAAEAPALRRLLLSCDLALATDVAKTLRATGDRETIELALRALRNDRYPARIAAAHALAVYAELSTASALTIALRDPIGGVRVAALAGLARIGVDSETAETCASLLDDELPFVRIAAIRTVAAERPRPARPRGRRTGRGACAAARPAAAARRGPAQRRAPRRREAPRRAR